MRVAEMLLSTLMTGRSKGPNRTVASIEDLLEEFVARWERGESPVAADYLDGLDEDDAIDLIYQEFHLREAAGEAPDPDEFIRRYGRYEKRLKRVLGLHEAGLVPDPMELIASIDLPNEGDWIGPYHLLRLMGQGGFARVFLAEDRDLEDRLLVVKVSDRPSTEPRMMARARHRNVVEVLRAGEAEEGRLHWVSMPFLGGATLADVLERRKALGTRPTTGSDLLDLLDGVAAPEGPESGLNRPARALIASLSYPKAVAWLFARLADALAHAYHRDVTHGDIKPSNILLSADAEPLLLDFNLAVHWRSTQEGNHREAGTPAYMAPERLRALLTSDQRIIRQRDRHLADIYALGLVMIEVLGGEPPTTVRSQKGPMRAYSEALLQERVDGLLWKRRSKAVPSSLRPILERCLAPDPADRYTLATHLAEDLDRWLTNQAPIHTPAPSLKHEVGRWLHRNCTPLLAGALILGAGLASAAVVWNGQRETVRSRAEAKVAEIWQSPEFSGMRYQLPGRWTPVELGDPVKLATQRLALYGVLGPNDWRQRDDVRILPQNVRDDLEAWNMEQVLRLAKALESRAGSKEDLRRALEILERATELQPARVLFSRLRGLRRQLGLPQSSASDSRVVPSWLDDYLLGIETEDEFPVEAHASFQRAHQSRPELLWVRLRLSHVLTRLGMDAQAIDHLRACATHYSESAWLRTELSVVLFQLGRLDEALAEANRAATLDPDLDLVYRNRLFVREALGDREASWRDLDRFRELTRFRGPYPGLGLRIESDWTLAPRLLAETEVEAGLMARAGNHDDLILLARIALHHQRSGENTQAIREWDRILVQDPKDLIALYNRTIAKIAAGERATADLEAIYLDPRRPELLSNNHEATQLFVFLASEYLRTGNEEAAIQVARQGVDQAMLFGQTEHQAALEYRIALAWFNRYHNTGDARLLANVSEHLESALNLSPSMLTHFATDPFFDALRDDLGWVPRTQTPN